MTKIKFPKKIVGILHPTVVTTGNGRFMVVTTSSNKVDGWYPVADNFGFDDAQKIFVKDQSRTQVSSKDWTWKVPNSKGNGFYTVAFDKAGWSCSCTGFSFRRKCKHIDIAKTKMN